MSADTGGTDGVRCPSCGQVFDSPAAVHGHSASCEAVIVVSGGMGNTGGDKVYHTSIECKNVPADPDRYRAVDPAVLAGHYRHCRRPACGDDYPDRQGHQGPSPATILRQADPDTSWAEVVQQIRDQCEVIGE